MTSTHRTPRRIGVLTGGGDCPGLNAVIRAVTKDAHFHRIEVIGIEDGFLGLIEDRVRPLDYRAVSGILQTGGTILGSSNKANPANFATGLDDAGEPIWEDVTDRCLRTIEKHGIEALVVIGGDGTMTCAQPFADAGIPCFGVPKTIDNDIVGTELTFGFQSAVDVATDALDRVHTTAESHSRVMVVEVMGRNAGWIALHAGVASGSDVILLPEIPFSIDAICEHIAWRRSKGRRATIICVSEGASPEGGEQIVRDIDPTSPDPIRLGGVGAWLAKAVESKTDVDARHVVLGHVQRGGPPVAADRVLATMLGHHATQLLIGGAKNRMVAVQSGRITDIPITEPANRQRLVPADERLLLSARSVFTSFGDGMARRP